MTSTEIFIKEYLSKKTNFAIEMTEMTGKYGVGTTHYEKAGIRTVVANTATLQNETKKYKPFYISLFDLKTIASVTDKLIIEFYQSKYLDSYIETLDRRRTLRITDGILRIGLRSFKELKESDNIDYKMTDFKSTKDKVLTTDELFICFDDSNRENSSLPLEHLFTYIKGLVEQGVKVLLINNKYIIETEEYKKLHKKVIGATMQF